MGGLIAGIAVSTLVSAISGYMGAEAQKEAYDKIAQASAEERAEFQKAYDQAFGPNSYNAQMQSLGAQAGQQFYDKVNDNAAWDRYVSGEKAYTAPADFTFTERQFTDDPSYKVRLQQGIDSLDQSNVANGLNLSGAALRATNDYAQNEASKEFANAYNRAFQRYTDDRNFDFNAWQQEAKQYYANLQAQLNGLNNVSNQGVVANQNQAQALDALARNNAASIQQQNTAQGASDMSGTQQVTSVLDALAKGINTGAGLYASQAGANYSPTNTTPIMGGPGGTVDNFSTTFLNGWNPQPTTPTTQNIVMNPVGV